MKQTTHLAILFAVFMLQSDRAAHGEYLYNLTDLNVFGGQTSSATGINNFGAVVGTAIIGNSPYPTGTNHAFLYDGVTHDMGSFGGPNTSPSDINDHGVVVGTASDSNGLYYGFVYDGAFHSVGDLGKPGTTHAYAINNNGQIVGNSYTKSGATHAYYYDGTMHDIDPTSLPSAYSEAIAINNLGDVIVYSSANSISKYYLYSISSGTSTDIPELIDPGHAWRILIPRGINDAGALIGDGYIGNDNFTHAFIYDGTLHDLGTHDPTSSLSTDDTLSSINASNIAVGIAYGYSYPPNQNNHYTGYNNVALYYSSATGVVDLNTIVDTKGWFISDAYAINDSGEIAALAGKGGIWHAVLLTPVPEPQSLTIVAIVLSAVFGSRGRNWHGKA